MVKIKIKQVVADHYEEMIGVIETANWEDKNESRAKRQEIIKILARLYKSGCTAACKTYNPN